MTGAHDHGHAHAHDHANLPRRAALLSVSFALALVVAKAWAAAGTGSVSVLGSLADSALDLLASLITLGGVAWAARPADDEHRFGHGKAEALSALAQSLLVLVSAGLIGWQAALRLANPAPLAAPAIGIAVSLGALVTTLFLVRYQRRVIAATGSVAIAADSLHYQADVALNISVAAALALEAFAGLAGADAILGLAIALYLARAGVRAALIAIDVLMDREWDEAERQRLLAVAAEHPVVRGVHDLRTRGRGMHRHAQFHVWVDPETTVAAAHDVVDAVEARVRGAFPGVGVLVHVDPTGHRDDRPPQG